MNAEKNDKTLIMSKPFFLSNDLEFSVSSEPGKKEASFAGRPNKSGPALCRGGIVEPVEPNRYLRIGSHHRDGSILDLVLRSGPGHVFRVREDPSIPLAGGPSPVREVKSSF